jgi:ParB family chromosome partitioning protein
MKIPFDDILIDWDSNNSRVGFDEDEWREECSGLADTIQDRGQLQPVVVVAIEHEQYKYKLVFGYRRSFAMLHILGMVNIEAYITDKEYEEDPLDNLIENLARKDLTYWDSCVALKRTFPPEWSHRQVAKAVGKSHGWAYHRWGVWKLPQEVIDQVEAGCLTAADVNLIMSKTEAEQTAAAKAIQEAKEKGLTNREIGQQLINRKTLRPKKEIQKKMTWLLANDRTDCMHCLRWAIGEINDPQLEELL